MTRIDPKKPLTREIDVRYLGEPVVVEIHATYLRMRIKRSRYSHEILWKELLEHLIRKPAKRANYA